MSVQSNITLSQAIKNAFEGNLSPQAVKPFTEDASLAKGLFELVAAKGYDDTQLQSKLMSTEADLAAYKAGEKPLKTYAAQKLLEKVAP